VNPPAPITADEIRRLAQLAHLEVANEDIAPLAREIGAVLAYVEQLKEVDVTDVPPTAHVQKGRVPLRPDEPEPSLSREDALREAPRVSMEGFAVPGFVDEG